MALDPMLVQLFQQLLLRDPNIMGNAGQQALLEAQANAIPETGSDAIATNLFNNAVDMQLPISDATADKFNNLFGDGTGFSNAKYETGEILDPDINDNYRPFDPIVSPSELIIRQPNTDPYTNPELSYISVPTEDPLVHSGYNFARSNLVRIDGDDIDPWDRYRPHKNTALGRWFYDKWNT